MSAHKYFPVIQIRTFVFLFFFFFLNEEKISRIPAARDSLWYICFFFLSDRDDMTVCASCKPPRTPPIESCTAELLKCLIDRIMYGECCFPIFSLCGFFGGRISVASTVLHHVKSEMCKKKKEKQNTESTLQR